MQIDGLVTRVSDRGFAQTLAGLESALEHRGITIFARIDHAAGAIAAGMTLPPTIVLLFGNPKAGTPLMQSAQTAGIDLPLKMLVWENESGRVSIAYNDPTWIGRRHGISPSLDKTLEAMRQLLDALSAEASTK